MRIIPLMIRKNELLANKTKQEKMKKRDLVLKMKTEQRKRERGGAEAAMGAEEKAEMRRREMEKMREEMRIYKQKMAKELMRREREDRSVPVPVGPNNVLRFGRNVDESDLSTSQDNGGEELD